MREVRPSEFYQRMSVEDQIQFDRWLKANAVVASIFTAAVVAMAFVYWHNSGPADESTAGIRTVSKSELLASDRTNWGKASAEFMKHGTPMSKRSVRPGARLNENSHEVNSFIDHLQIFLLPSQGSQKRRLPSFPV